MVAQESELLGTTAHQSGRRAFPALPPRGASRVGYRAGSDSGFWGEPRAAHRLAAQANDGPGGFCVRSLGRPEWRRPLYDFRLAWLALSLSPNFCHPVLAIRASAAGRSARPDALRIQDGG